MSASLKKKKSVLLVNAMANDVRLGCLPCAQFILYSVHVSGDHFLHSQRRTSQREREREREMSVCMCVSVCARARVCVCVCVSERERGGP